MLGESYVRIIGGKFKNSKIFFQPDNTADYDSLRPSLVLTRKILFDWLNFDISNTKVLDMFSGSGVLSFEAISRGAKQTTMLEKNRRNIQWLKHNTERLNINSDVCEVWHGLSELWLEDNDINEFDVIFIDPPHKNFDIENLLTKLFTKQIKNHCLIYLELPKKHQIKLESLSTTQNIEIHKQKIKNTISFYLLKKKSS